jgi:hypothetical protein
MHVSLCSSSLSLTPSSSTKASSMASSSESVVSLMYAAAARLGRAMPTTLSRAKMNPLNAVRQPLVPFVDRTPAGFFRTFTPTLQPPRVDSIVCSNVGMARFSVLNVPMHRRLQTAALLCFNWPTTLLGGLVVMVACLYFNTVLRYLMLAYIGFILLVDTGAFV